MKVDYDKLNRVVRRQKAALTLARGTGDRAKIVEVCRSAVREWNEPGMMWPDDWPRWQNALDDVFPVFQAPTLSQLARDDGGGPLPEVLESVAEFETKLRAQCDRLRETAAGMRAGRINQWHAANRIDKIANEIASERKGE